MAFGIAAHIAAAIRRILSSFFQRLCRCAGDHCGLNVDLTSMEAAGTHFACAPFMTHSCMALCGLYLAMSFVYRNVTAHMSLLCRCATYAAFQGDT